MNGNVFEAKPLVGTGFLQKLFRQFPQENAVIELNNLLATKALLHIAPKEVEDIESKYRLSLHKEFKLNLEEFYAVYLNYCLADKVLTTEQLNELSHLKHLLHLDDTTIDQLYSKVGEVIYRTSFQEAVEDGRLTNSKKEFLNKLENTLRLPKELADRISVETRTAYVKNYIAQIIADQRLSPAEEQEIQAIAGSLNINIQLNDETKEQLRKLKLYWALENLPLPVIQPGIVLQKSELCHISIPNVNWYELRSVRQRTSYSGYSTSFRLAKGFYLRSGSYRSQSYSQDVMKLIDTGTLYLTGKRIIFTGIKKNANINLSKIINFTPHNDGVEIDKDTGKSPMLQIAQNVDVFCMMLERLLNER